MKRNCDGDLNRDSSGLLNGRQLMAELGIKHAAFHLWKKAGKLRQFEVARPLGQKRYSAALVADYKAGRSTVHFGAGSRPRPTAVAS